MARRQRGLARRAGRIQNSIEIRHAAGMKRLILMRILVWIGVLHRASRGLRFKHGPGAVALFQIVGDLHACAGGRAGLGPEFDLGMGLVSVDGNVADIHLHGADVQRADGRQVVQDAGTDGVIIARVVLTSADGAEGGECHRRYEESFHKHVHFRDLQSIPHEEGDANVQNGENSKGVTKGTVNNMPELKDALGAAEESDAL
jgi:hypothetical protein